MLEDTNSTTLVSDSVQGDPNVQVLAQEFTIDTTTDKTGGFNINFSETWTNIGKIIAGIAVTIWIVYASWNFLNPKNRGSGLQRIGGLWPMLAAGVAAILFWDLNNTVDVANFLLEVGNTIFNGAKSALGFGS